MWNEKLSHLCLFGAGGHGRVVASQIRRAGGKDLCFGDATVQLQQKVDGIPVLFRDAGAIREYRVLVTIGDNRYRRRIWHICADQTVIFIAEPERYFAQAPGLGTVCLSGAVVNTGARIGENVIINSNAVVEHDVYVGAHTHLAPGSIAGGGAHIGSGVLIGTNATVMPGVSICDDVTVGAGAVVCADITAPGVFAGVPAVELRKMTGNRPK